MLLIWIRWHLQAYRSDYDGLVSQWFGDWLMGVGLLKGVGENAWFKQWNEKMKTYTIRTSRYISTIHDMAHKPKKTPLPCTLQNSWRNRHRGGEGRGVDDFWIRFIWHSNQLSGEAWYLAGNLVATTDLCTLNGCMLFIHRETNDSFIAGHTCFRVNNTLYRIPVPSKRSLSPRELWN